MRELELSGSKVFVLETVKGLESEAEKVGKAFREAKPEVVALPISPEELDGLKQLVDGVECDIGLTNYEEIFARKLAAYGEVRVPPPSYEEAVRLAGEEGVELAALDMDEKIFTDLYVENVTGLELVRYTMRLKRMRKKKFDDLTASEFSKAWDRSMNKTKGFREVERAREEYMARSIRQLARGGKKLLAIVDVERGEGVMRGLRT